MSDEEKRGKVKALLLALMIFFSIFAIGLLGFIYSPEAVQKSFFKTITGKVIEGPGSGLVSYWKFDNSAVDSAGSNTGTLVNGAAYATGKINNALSLTGTNYFSVPDINLNNNAYSIAFWFNYQSTSGWSALFTDYDHSSGDSALHIDTITGKFAFWNNAAYYLGPTLIQNTWNHAVIIVSSGTATLYLNNVNSGTTSNAPSISVSAIGSNRHNENYKGMLDDVRIYNRALSAVEVNELFTYTGSPAYSIYHPADTNQDLKLEIGEYTGYRNAWKGQLTWPLAPSPPADDYHSRALFLWKSGEVYYINSSTTCPPDLPYNCWVKTPGSSTSYTDISSCQVLNSPGTAYRLTTDISNYAGTCFNITANNIILEGNGKKIDGDDIGADYGIYALGRKNITIRNFANISDFGNVTGGAGIEFISTNYSSINNVNTYSNALGLGIWIGSSNNTIKDIKSILETGYGMDIYQANSNIIENIQISNSSKACFMLEYSSQNTLRNINLANCGEFNGGIYIYGSDFNTLDKLNSTNSENGLLIHYSNNLSISNIITNYNRQGTYIAASNWNKFNNLVSHENSFLTVSGGAGLVLSSSDYNLFINSSLKNNEGFGVYMFFSDYNNFTTLNASQNKNSGIETQDSTNNHLTGVNSINNSVYGASVSYGSAFVGGIYRNNFEFDIVCDADSNIYNRGASYGTINCANFT